MTNKEQLISIIIPCHNIINYIDKALESCLNQTYQNIEIILVENGSTDDSWGYCQKLVKKHNGKVFAYQSDPALFSGGARNLGIKKARGEYLAFLDDDDTFYLHAMKTLLDYCLEHNLDVAIGSVKINRLDTPEFILHEKISGIFIDDSRFLLTSTATSIKLYKSSFVKYFNIHFDTTRLSQDYMFYFLTMLISSRVGVISLLCEPIYNYIVRKDSSILSAGTNSLSFINVTINIIDEFEKRIMILEQYKRITGIFYGTSLEKHMITKAVGFISKKLSDLADYYMHMLVTNDEDRAIFDQYLLENDIFAKITAFERKYGAEETIKLYAHERFKKEDTNPEVITEKEDTNPEVITEKEDTNPEVITEKEDTNPEVIIEKEDTNPEVIIEKEDTNPDVTIKDFLIPILYPNNLKNYIKNTIKLFCPPIIIKGAKKLKLYLIKFFLYN